MIKNDTKLFQRAYCSIIYTINLFFLGGIISGLGPLIPFLAVRMDLHETDFGFVFTCRGLGYMSGCFLISKIDKFVKNYNHFYCLINFILGFGTYLVSLDISYI